MLILVDGGEVSVQVAGDDGLHVQRPGGGRGVALALVIEHLGEVGLRLHNSVSQQKILY